MRLVPALAIAVIVTVPAYAESLQPGLYPCRTPAGTQTGSSFVIGPDGRYGDTPDALTGTTDISMGEIRFRGAGNDGKIARVISDTRIKIGKRIFCEREAPLPRPEPAAEPAQPSDTPPQPETPGPKLIVVKPELRR